MGLKLIGIFFQLVLDYETAGSVLDKFFRKRMHIEAPVFLNKRNVSYAVGVYFN